jgi:peptidoglycan/xylan/chitin deacetylase (PgdA/CDA1 family)
LHGLSTALESGPAAGAKGVADLPDDPPSASHSEQLDGGALDNLAAMTVPTGDGPARKRSLHWELRERLGTRGRRRARRAADAMVGPFLGTWNASSATDSVALTLDDGPDPEVTPALIDRLAELDVHATFFILTLRAEKYPQLVRRLAAHGHEVALHGLDHRRVTGLPGREVQRYLEEARSRLEQVTGRKVTMYRPPYGSQSVISFRAARRAGLDVVAWNGHAADWADRPASEVTRAAVEACRPGGIFLFHERLEPDPGRDAPVTTFDRVSVVSEIVEQVRQRSLSPCTVGDLTRGGSRMLRTAWFRP